MKPSFERASYEYIFVLDGITVGVRDSVRDAGGVPNVAYLNAPKAGQLNVLPAGAALPITEPPVSRQETLRMLKAESGKSFSQEEVRRIPSGLGSALNGGVNVIVGGDLNNFLSWKYSLLFGPDKNLVYYGKGIDH